MRICTNFVGKQEKGLYLIVLSLRGSVRLYGYVHILLETRKKGLYLIMLSSRGFLSVRLCTNTFLHLPPKLGNIYWKYYIFIIDIKYRFFPIPIETILHLIMLSLGSDELSIQLSNIFKMVHYYNITEEDVFQIFWGNLGENLR